MKPKNCIYPDCFNCTLDDCEYDVPEKKILAEMLKLTRKIL